MAGGDGSQAVVASVAAAHGLPFICIPTGTRNHLALDLGLDRDHPLFALGAFGAARESSIDLAEVNGQVFVNNVSLGVYARIVASDEYREAKGRTVAELLPTMLGPGAPQFGLMVDGPDGPVEGACVIEVSNNLYRLTSIAGFGSRPRLDGGSLGVTTLSVHNAADVNRLVACELAGHPERFEGWRQWTSTDLVVDGLPETAAAVDGEARTWSAPLHFLTRPGALRPDRPKRTGGVAGAPAPASFHEHACRPGAHRGGQTERDRVRGRCDGLSGHPDRGVKPVDRS